MKSIPKRQMICIIGPSSPPTAEPCTQQQARTKIKDKFKNTTHVAAVVRKEWGTTIWKSLTK